jgi:hypothetical protein
MPNFVVSPVSPPKQGIYPPSGKEVEKGLLRGSIESSDTLVIAESEGHNEFGIIRKVGDLARDHLMAKREKSTTGSDTADFFRSLEERVHGPGDLTKRLVEGLRIPALGPARQFIYRGNPPEQKEFFPDRCWAITVMPSFHNWGLFAVFESRSLVRCAFVWKGDMPDKPEIDYAVVDSFFEISDWSDPVLDMLAKGPLAPVPDRSQPEGRSWATCDGIGYFLQVDTPDVSVNLRFSNPLGSHYRSLQRAACDLARRVSRVIENAQVSSFVRTWAGYVRG